MPKLHRDKIAAVIDGHYRVTGETRWPLQRPEPAFNAEAAGGFVALAVLVALARYAFLVIG